MKKQYVTSLVIDNNIMLSKAEIKTIENQIRKSLQISIVFHPSMKGNIVSMAFDLPNNWNVIGE